MRLVFLLFLLGVTLAGSGYWYSVFDTVCRIPIHYRVGAIDERFGTHIAELERIAKNAEAVWEDTIGENLFVYDSDATLPINLVFDERQKNAEIEAELKEDLRVKEGMTESVARQYEVLINQFRTLKKEYESQLASYEKKLASYNTTVEDWNNKGGAPEPVIANLEKTKQELTSDQSRLESKIQKLNGLVEQLNAIGAKGNSLVTDYNNVVHEYNDQFSEAHEFTQGDYTGQEINIYQFDAEDELTLVLAHEFGHALSLDHVENEKSIMYPQMGKQSLQVGISTEDREEFNTVCAEKSKIIRSIESFFE